MKPLSSDFLPRVSGAKHLDVPVVHPRLQGVTAAIVNCSQCERLRHYCAVVARDKKRAYREDTYWGRPVPGFGDPDARVLLVGLAPAAHGANRTGRVFTGDGPGGSSDFLMAALHRAGLANRPTSRAIDDGLVLSDVFISMAVRCAPPDNKPLPDELTRCLQHLDAETAVLSRVRVVVALGKVGFDAWLRLCQRRGIRLSPRPVFGHDQVVRIGQGQATLVGCYHPSRQNTNTGKLTPQMIDDVLRRAKSIARR